MDVIADLEAEQDRLEAILGDLDDGDWRHPSAAAGWTITDVVIHLAQTEELVVATLQGASSEVPFARAPGEALDDTVARAVAAERAEPPEVFERWRRARRAALDALRAADPNERVAWAAYPLKPSTLATTRLAEHWAHGLDITTPLEIPFPDTPRLRHIAWLGAGSLPYAFALAGLEPQPVRCQLEGVDGEPWVFGPADAPSVIAGRGAAFCRVGARRLAPEASGLTAAGPHGETALRLLRNYAG